MLDVYLKNYNTDTVRILINVSTEFVMIIQITMLILIPENVESGTAVQLVCCLHLLLTVPRLLCFACVTPTLNLTVVCIEL